MCRFCVFIDHTGPGIVAVFFILVLPVMAILACAGKYKYTYHKGMPGVISGPFFYAHSTASRRYSPAFALSKRKKLVTEAAKPCNYWTFLW